MKKGKGEDYDSDEYQNVLEMIEKGKNKHLAS